MPIRKKLNEVVGKIPCIGDILTTEVNSRGLAGLALGSYMALVNAVPALAANVTLEAVSGEQTGTLDTKVSGTLPIKIGYFFRNRTSVNYETDNQVGSFSLLDLTYPLVKGFDFVAEGQFTNGMPFDPRLGVQYFKGFKSGITAYALVTRNFSENPNTELTTVLGYTRDIDGKLKLVGRWEEIINIGDENYNYDTSRLRLGIGNGQVTVGPALDIFGIGSGERPTYAPGVFVQVKLK